MSGFLDRSCDSEMKAGPASRRVKTSCGEDRNIGFTRNKHIFCDLNHFVTGVERS